MAFCPGADFEYEPNKTLERTLRNDCGVFAGYFFTGHWHEYLYIQRQSYLVTNRNNGSRELFSPTDIGPGLGYRYFMTKYLYLQQDLHLYWQKTQTKAVGGETFTLRETDITPTIRLGYQF